jgi:hypothetical protein
MLEERIRDLRPSVVEIDALPLRNDRNLHERTPGNQGCCRLATHGLTVLNRACPLCGDATTSANRQGMKRFRQSVADVPELPVADKGLAIHVPIVS